MKNELNSWDKIHERIAKCTTYAVDNDIDSSELLYDYHFIGLIYNEKDEVLRGIENFEKMMFNDQAKERFRLMLPCVSEIDYDVVSKKGLCISSIWAYEQTSEDRVVYVSLNDEFDVVGLNYHQGVDRCDEQFAEPCDNLTLIYTNVCKNADAEVSLEWKINKAIDLHQSVFLDFRMADTLTKPMATRKLEVYKKTQSLFVSIIEITGSYALSDYAVEYLDEWVADMSGHTDQVDELKRLHALCSKECEEVGLNFHNISQVVANIFLKGVESK